MRRNRLLLLCFLMALSGACSTIQVKYEYDGGTDFSQIETFDWMATTGALVKCGDGTLASSNVYDAAIRAAVLRELNAKGFEQESKDPDVLIVFCTKGDHARSHRHWGAIDLDEYIEGTLILDILDARTQQLLWRGTAEGGVPDKPTPEQIEATTNVAVKKLLNNFPPKQG